MAKGQNHGNTKYKPDLYPKQVHRLCLLGATNKQIAEFFEVNEETIYRWQKEHEEFGNAIKSGKLVADVQVAEALFHRAIGQTVTETKTKRMVDEDGNEMKTLLTEETVRHIHPDTTACRWWLNNRQRELWREKTEVDVNIHDDMGAKLNAAKERLKKSGDSD